MKTNLKNNLIFKLFSFLLLVAPVMANTRASDFLFGEIEIPDSLKN